MKKLLIIILIFFTSCTAFTNNEKIEINTPSEKVSNLNTTNVEDIGKIPGKEEIKENELTFHFDFPIIKNSKINESIESWGKKIIEETKIEYKKNKIISNPELHFSFEIEENSYITSIFYSVMKSIGLAQDEYFTKIFYTGKKGDIFEAKDFLIEDKKEDIKKIIIQKLDELKINYSKENINLNLDNFLNNPNIYFDEDEIFFVFDRDIIAPYNEGEIKISFYLKEFSDFLNPDIFLNIKYEEEEEKEIEIKEKLKQEKIAELKEEKLKQEKIKELKEKEKTAIIPEKAEEISSFISNSVILDKKEKNM